jgi:hypothetical protein
MIAGSQKVGYTFDMDIKEIESAIAQLPPSELAELAKWFEEFQAQVWDEQLEQDVKAGRLDALLQEAERDFEQGQCEPL